MKTTIAAHAPRSPHPRRAVALSQRVELRISDFGFRSSPAFTLLEILAVISIIAILAGLIFPVAKTVNATRIRQKGAAELAQIESAIELYKTKLGHYPPDNPGMWSTNQLYFELKGCTLANGVLRTLDGSASVATTDLNSIFGGKVAGIVNCTQGASGDEARTAISFLPGGLKPGQVLDYKNGAKLILCSVNWSDPNNYPLAGSPGSNPFGYNSSSPVNNPNTFDLWVDVLVDGKTNRICNWTKKPLIVSAPY